MLDCLVFFLFALDLRVFGYDYPNFVEHNFNEVEVVNYNEMGSGSCPKIIEPLCATNGREFLYFENKCQMELRNYEQLTQGLMDIAEYYECPLSFCNIDCPTCDLRNEPVCAIETLTGEMKKFANPCEVERKICTTQKDWQIVDPYECNAITENNFLNPSNTQSQYFECPLYCTLEYQPICARFMSLEKEFLNECELQTTICQTEQKWEIIRQGPCRTQSDAESFNTETACPKSCSHDNKPVCALFANELKEFPNKCALDSWNCESDIKWQLVSLGPCSTDSKGLFSSVSKCPKLCSREYSPVCAKLDGKLREFPNECELQRSNCELNQTWKMIKSGPCSSNSTACPQFCAHEYRPICAQFNSKLREFWNQCELQKTICETKTNWEYFKKGSCPLLSESESSCPKVCTKEFSPVCASFNNKTKEFFNNCELQKKSCETNVEWQLLNRGPCNDNEFNKIVESACVNQDLDPICAVFDLKIRTFNNICQLEEEIKNSSNNWFILHKGICSNTSYPTSTAVVTSSSITESSYTTTIQASTVSALSETSTPTTEIPIEIMTKPNTLKYAAPELKTTAEAAATDPYGGHSNDHSSEQYTYKHYGSDKTTVVATIDPTKSNENSTEENVNIDNISNNNGHGRVSNLKEETAEGDKNREKYYNNTIRNRKKESNRKTLKVNPKITLTNEKDAEVTIPSKNKNCKENLATTLRNSLTQNNLEEAERDNASFPEDDKILNRLKVQTPNYLERKKLIKQQIQSLLDRAINGYSSDENSSNEGEPYDTQETLINSDPKHINGKSKSQIPNHAQSSWEVTHSYNATSFSENEAKYFNISNKQNLDYNEHTPQYPAQNPTNFTHNNESNSNIKEASLTKSDEKNEDRKDLTNLVRLTTKSYPTHEKTKKEPQSHLKYTKLQESTTNYNSTTANKSEIYNGAVYKAPVYDTPTYYFIYTVPNHPLNSPATNHSNNLFAQKANQNNSVTSSNILLEHFQFLSSLAAIKGDSTKPNSMPGPGAMNYKSKMPAVKQEQVEIDISISNSLYPPVSNNIKAFNKNLTSKAPNLTLRNKNNHKPEIKIITGPQLQQTKPLLPSKASYELSSISAQSLSHLSATPNYKNYLNNPLVPRDNNSKPSLLSKTSPTVPASISSHSVKTQLQQTQPLFPPKAFSSETSSILSQSLAQFSDVPKSYQNSPPPRQIKESKVKPASQPLNPQLKQTQPVVVSKASKEFLDINSQVLPQPLTMPYFHPPKPVPSPLAPKPVTLHASDSPPISVDSTLLNQILETLESYKSL